MSQRYGLGPSESGTHSSIKRRRGRPRKDESFSQPQRLVPTNPLSYTQARVSISPSQTQLALAKEENPLLHNHKPNIVVDNEMVGNEISGVLEGAFEAGYFLSMRVPGTETYLKGLVFEPGKLVPITRENDVAPSAKMYTRMDLSMEKDCVSLAKGRLELLATLSVEMDEDEEVNGLSEHDPSSLEHLAKRSRIEEGDVSCEEIKAAMTLNQLEIVAMREDGAHGECVVAS